ncbi:MAG: phosphate transport system regulatory protein PhoU [Deltaproteobacteria bacterium]|nr:MAG: phosphate transport system regulatory protein PhoU [Deltaproteobacteria bacterium]
MNNPHILKTFDKELKTLKDKILEMGEMVQEAVATSIRSLVERDSDLARGVIENDRKVNELEVQIDGICLSLIALRQPAGGDLRFIATGLKVNVDLERIGDLAVNISERALDLNKEPQLKPYIDIPRMDEDVRWMIQGALDAYIKRDEAIAMEVIQRDEEVDQLNNQIARELFTYMVEDAKKISSAMKIMMVSKYLERAADHAVNVAEQAIFMIKGTVVRHQKII